jgi:hypothetical protein
VTELETELAENAATLEAARAAYTALVVAAAEAWLGRGS